MKQTIVKINQQYKASILELDHVELFELAILKDGEISYEFSNDVERFVTMEDAEERLAEIISEIIAKEFNGQAEVDNQAFIEAFDYNIWAAVEVENGKVFYFLNTTHNGRYHDKGLDEAEANHETRKTWKGLTNYLEKFGA